MWMHGSDDWLKVWRNFLLNITDAKTGRLLLKSPNHTFRIGALLKAFPEASYVWMVRNPETVFFSNRKMWASMFDTYALWDWEPPKLDLFLQQAFRHAEDCLAHAVKTLSRDRLVVVDFDRLIDKSVETIAAINQRLSLCDWDSMEIPVKETAAGKANYRNTPYPTDTISPEIREVIQHLHIVQQSAIVTHGVFQ